MKRKRYERNRKFTGRIDNKDSLFKSRRDIKKLVNKALKDKPKNIPAKGYVFLKSLDEGTHFETQTGTRGLLISKNINCEVIVTHVNVAKEDKAYYLGKQIFPETTEVKKVRV
tara:strand:+ start:1126 stop:1464 length:339 start_codon:yes stop_codon:yes gene_type:complete